MNDKHEPVDTNRTPLAVEQWDRIPVDVMIPMYMPPAKDLKHGDDGVIGRNIRRLRMRQGLTLEDVAKAMQQSGRQWGTTMQSNIENGVRALRASEVVPLLQAMGYTSDAETRIGEVYASEAASEFSALLLKAWASAVTIGREWRRFHETRARMQAILDGDDLDLLGGDNSKRTLALVECAGLDGHMSNLAWAIASKYCKPHDTGDPQAAEPYETSK